MRRRDLALSYCRARPLQQMIMKAIKQFNISFYLKPTKIVVIKSLFQINKINEIKIFLFAWDENCGAKIFLLIYGHICLCNMHICAWENWDLIYYTFAQQATLCDRGRSKWEILKLKGILKVNWNWYQDTCLINCNVNAFNLIFLPFMPFLGKIHASKTLF